MDHRKGDSDSPGPAQRPPGRCPDHRSVSPFFASILVIVILVCGEIHAQYVRERVLFIRRCDLIDDGSMTSRNSLKSVGALPIRDTGFSVTMSTEVTLASRWLSL